MEPCPEGTTEKLVIPASFQDASAKLGFPATGWLANFRSRFATKRWFLQSNIPIRSEVTDQQVLSPSHTGATSPSPIGWERAGVGATVFYVFSETNLFSWLYFTAIVFPFHLTLAGARSVPI